MHLDRETEADLVLRWQRHGDAKAKETLMRAFWPAIAALAGKRGAPGLERQDLVQIAAAGFSAGIDKWDAARGLRLYTFAVWHSRAALNRACKKASKIGGTEVVLIRKHYEEDAGDGTVYDFVDPSPDPEEACVASERTRMLRDAVASLKGRERTIIHSRWIEGNRTLDSLAEEFGITRERVRQIEAAAFRKIRRTLSRRP